MSVGGSVEPVKNFDNYSAADLFLHILQIGDDRSLIAEARQHMSSARQAIDQAAGNQDLTSSYEEVELSVSAMEAWAKACDDGEAAVKRGREALAAGNRDEAAGHCQQARGHLDGGLKCESLAREVKELEQALNAGIILYTVPAVHSPPFRCMSSVLQWS